MKERDEVEERFKWDLTPLYASVGEWRKAKESLVAGLPRVRDLRGTLASSATALLRFLTLDSENERLISRLALYASLLSDQDVRNADNLSLVKEMDQVETDYAQMTDFALPELTAIDDATFDKFLGQEPGLAPFRMSIDRIRRTRAHTLSAAEEAIMAKTSILGNTPYDAFSIFSDAEMPWPRVTLADGEEVELNPTAFSILRSSADGANRKAAFETFWDFYSQFRGTFGELLNGEIRKRLFRATVRRYPSCLEAALDANDIPAGVYHSLIENVNRSLPTFHRYLRLKARLLGMERLCYSDVYAPAVAEVELTFSADEARQMVQDALAPLGDDYRGVVRRAFDERWIDAMPSRGKATGAYSNGAAYDTHPYILMNFDGRYDSVGTLIHELGHTMQSYYSNKRQPYPTADYSIFVAEVASTFNEALLDHLMLSRLTDKGQRISLLMSILDGFKGTLFRQTQFAEFQLEATRMAERGEPITGKSLSELYLSIARKYYGHDASVCDVDGRVDIEWAYIPHFYMGFYVYQYSTSFVASQALSEDVIGGKDGSLARYLDFLAAGGSKLPLEELRDAGVDMLSSEPFTLAIKKMEGLMDMVESLMES